MINITPPRTPEMGYRGAPSLPQTPQKRGREEATHAAAHRTLFTLSPPPMSRTIPTSIQDAIDVQDLLEFTDNEGQIHSLTPFAHGDYTTCFTIDDREGWVFKTFRSEILEKKRYAIPRYTENKNAQYKELQNAKIPVAVTISVKGGWLQERLPCMVEKLIDWDRETQHFTELQQCVIDQIRTIFRQAWRAGIDIDGLPRNFGYSIENGLPAVKLFDFREEREDGGNPLAPYLNQCLERFARGNQAIYADLDPRKEEL